MQIGELFLRLGIKGTDQSQKALQGVKGTLGEVSTAGLAAKAGILAVVYGIEQLVAGSNAAGASLMSFEGATGLSAETLQQWQYAARQANVTAEDMQNSFTGLQSSMIKMAMGQGMPQGFSIVKNAVDIDPNRIRDTLYMMEKLAEYAKKEGNVDFANEQLKSFGLNLNQIAAMRRGAFDPEKLKNAPHYSHGEIESLARMKAQWGNLEQQFEMGIGRLNVRWGPTFIKDLSAVSKELLKLAGSFANLTDKTRAFETLTVIFKGWGLIFDGIGMVTDKLSSLLGSTETGTPDKSGKRTFGEGTWWMSGINKMEDFYLKSIDPEHNASARAMQQATIHTINHNTNVVAHVTEAQNGQDTAQHVKKMIDRTARTRPAQARAN